MNYIATITSKKQLTIPAALFNRLNLREGEKVLLTTRNNEITIARFATILDRLAGSVQAPARFKGLTADDMIAKAKKEHFKL